jgi:hypothetical protein
LKAQSATIIAIVLLRFFWAAAIMLFAFAGVTSPARNVGSDCRVRDPWCCCVT